jgi:hypothetical protein
MQRCTRASPTAASAASTQHETWLHEQQGSHARRHPHIKPPLPPPRSTGAEVLQDALPGTYVYKAFNTIGVEHMPHGEDGSSIPGWSGGQLAMLLAGSEERKDVAKGIVEALGWLPAYVGPIRYVVRTRSRYQACTDDTHYITLL